MFMTVRLRDTYRAYTRFAQNARGGGTYSNQRGF